MKDQLRFDVTDANTIADSDSVGAFVRASDGTLIDKQTINSTQWLQVAAALFDGAGTAITSTGGALDVNIKTSDITLNVDLDGIYNVSTNPTPDNVGIIAFGRATTPGLSDQTFTPTGATAASDAVVAANVHALDTNSFMMGYNGTTWDRVKTTSGAINIADGGNTITVDASDLDIRDLAYATDSVTAYQGTDPWVIGDGGNSITVDASDLDIRDLAAATDSVSSWTKDGSGNSIGSHTGALDVYLTNAISATVNDAALADTAFAAKNKSCTTTASVVVTSALTARKYIDIYNNGNQKIYIGGAAVTTADGFPLSPGSYLELRAGAAQSLYMISALTAQDVRTLELS